METIRTLFNRSGFVVGLVGLATAIGLVIVRVVPDLAPHAGELSKYFFLLAVVVIFGWKVGDFAEKWGIPSEKMLTNIVNAMKVLFEDEDDDGLDVDDIVKALRVLLETETTNQDTAKPDIKPNDSVDIQG